MKNMIFYAVRKILLYGKKFIYSLYSFISISITDVTVCYGLFREVNCFRSSCVARQERNHSEKVSERERCAYFAVAMLFGPQFSALS